jgi:hypothetical protein
MISVALALRLRRAGVAWRPRPGDRFVAEGSDIEDQVFVLSDMTVDIQDAPGGPVIGFNGTVEWALDSLEKEDALWLPRENQLRDLLAGTFRRLDRTTDGYRVTTEVAGRERAADAADAEDAYALALLGLIEADAADG